MINNVDTDEGSALAIENDNCSSQYKWPGHFRVLQMKKKFQSLEFRESNVGGLSKVTIRKKNCSWKLLSLFRKDGKLSRFKIPRKAISRILFTKKLTAKSWISQKLKEN